MSCGALLTLTLTLVAAPCSPPAHPLLSEILYDALGDDTGFEFVELFNPLDRAFPLAGLRLEAGDGAGPGRWSLRWTGGARDTIPCRGRFVIGGARVVPAPNALVTLALQNGPDAIRLVWRDGAVEQVGYGELEFSEYACGAPAPDVAGGEALARIPDASDRGSNALDWAPAPPSPGLPNVADRDLGWRAGTLAIEPEQPAPLAPVRLLGTVVNRGARSLAAAEARVVVEIVEAGGARTFADVPLLPALAPADTAALAIDLPGWPAGKPLVRARLVLARDERPANDLDSVRVRVGPGPLLVTEIQFHPGAGEGEWVEVRNRSVVALDLGAFTLSDRGTGRGTPRAIGGLAPDSLALWVQDRDAVLRRYPTLDSARVVVVVPWSSLNNSDDAAGVADQVVIREHDGTPCDRVAYSARGVPAGTPLELEPGGGFVPAADPGGSPLSPRRPPVAVPERFRLSARRVREGEPVALIWSLPWPRARLAADLYDLAGRSVGRVLEEQGVPARGERTLALGGVLPGVYALALRARSEPGSDEVMATRALRIERGRP